MSFQGKKNIYVCDACKGHIVTVDLEDGVTPFVLKCRAKHGCGGMMQSSMYCVFDQKIGADHEWYRPSAAEIVPAGSADHVAMGGLLLRRVQA